jgi:GntR family transcriptional regulator/MocR family aminotransferase
MSLSIYKFSKDSASELPIYRQLYLHFKQLILRGDLKRDAQIPATRILATKLSLSRNTIKTAIDQLAAEGYVEARRGAGVFVCMDNPDEYFSAEINDGHTTNPKIILPRVKIHPDVIKPSAEIKPSNRAFSVGVPDLSAFPLTLWRKIYAATLRQPEHRLMGFGDPLGLPELRQEISNYVKSSRGVRCTPEHVLVTTGAQQGLDLIARMLIKPGDLVAIEDPGYRGARSTLAMAGATLAPIPMTSGGIDIKSLAALHDVKLVYTTPAHQYPNAAVIPVSERLSLLKWAETANSWVIEDDYDSEFQFETRPIPSLQGLSEHNNVIYVGSFSKTLFPALRLGYLVLPEALINDARGIKQSVYGAQPMLEQMVTAKFMNGGHFLIHLKRMRGIYSKKSRALVEALQQHLGVAVEILGGHSGMHLVIVFRDDIDDEKLMMDFNQAGFAAAPLSQHYLSNPLNGLILGFGCASYQEIEDGVQALKALIKIAIKAKLRHVRSSTSR